MRHFFFISCRKTETHSFRNANTLNLWDFKKNIFQHRTRVAIWYCRPRDFLCRCSVSECYKGFRLYRPALCFAPRLVVVRVLGNISQQLFAVSIRGAIKVAAQVGCIFKRNLDGALCFVALLDSNAPAYQRI